MMVEMEDLGLALSLGCNHGTKATPATQNQHHHHQQRSAFQLNLLPSLFASSSSSPSTSLTVPNLHFSSAKNIQNPSWLDSFHSSSDRTSVGGGSVAGKGTVNAAEDEEAGVSSPNSTISSVSGKRSEREVTIRGGASAGSDDLDLGSRGMSDEEDGDTSRKKLRLSKDQSAILEESFKEHNTLNPVSSTPQAKARSGETARSAPPSGGSVVSEPEGKVSKFPPNCISNSIFALGKQPTKLKQTEVDCEFLKRCCEQLTEENRRLQKEVQELRQLKLSPQFYMQMAPPTTLTMCPSCERVGAPPSSGAAASTANGPHHRGLPLSSWGTSAPVPIRPFEALHPRS
ncbi:hypothetical protein V2J09_020712 [Rumex salicifolius]